MKKILAKIESLVADEYFSEVGNRKVCHVVRHNKTEILPYNIPPVPYVQWTGSTESEYFTAKFYGGVLSIVIAEREMELTEDRRMGIAVCQSLKKLVPHIKSERDIIKIAPQHSQYIMNDYTEDLANITFRDVMKILDWRYLSRKVKEDDSFEG